MDTWAGAFHVNRLAAGGPRPGGFGKRRRKKGRGRMGYALAVEEAGVGVREGVSAVRESARRSYGLEAIGPEARGPEAGEPEAVEPAGPGALVPKEARDVSGETSRGGRGPERPEELSGETVPEVSGETSDAGAPADAGGEAEASNAGAGEPEAPGAGEAGAPSAGAGAPGGSPTEEPADGLRLDADVEGLDRDTAAEVLGDRIATLAAHIHASVHRLLTLIAAFDRLEGWKPGGHRSCAHWLAFRTGYDLGTAREYVRVARALEELPETSRAMSEGRLSFSQVRALTRAATKESESELLELAEGTTVSRLERVVRAWKVAGRKDEAALERERHRSRKLSIFPDDEGMYVIRGRLEPEVGALLMRAVEAASDALYRERPYVAAEAAEAAEASDSELAGGGGDDDGPRGAREAGSCAPRRAAPVEVRSTRREAARRRADAIGLLAEWALAAGGGKSRRRPSGAVSRNGDGKDRDQPAPEAASEEGPAPGTPEPGGGRRTAPPACGSCGRRELPALPLSGSRAGLYTVVLHADPETLSAEGEPGRSELEDGTRISPETSRRLSCDAGVVTVTHAPDGSVLDVGRKRRSIPPALRRALEVRDRGCRFPGCGSRFADAHHVIHWADGGETSLANTLLLCRFHHRLVHEGGWRVEWWGKGRPAFVDPKGQAHVDAGWSPPDLRGETAETADAADAADPAATPSGAPPDPVRALVEGNRRRGVDPDAWTASAEWTWRREIPEAVLRRACDAMW